MQSGQQSAGHTEDGDDLPEPPRKSDPHGAAHSGSKTSSRANAALMGVKTGSGLFISGLRFRRIRTLSCGRSRSTDNAELEVHGLDGVVEGVQLGAITLGIQVSSDAPTGNRSGTITVTDETGLSTSMPIDVVVDSNSQTQVDEESDAPPVSVYPEDCDFEHMLYSIKILLNTADKWDSLGYDRPAQFLRYFLTRGPRTDTPDENSFQPTGNMKNELQEYIAKRVVRGAEHAGLVGLSRPFDHVLSQQEFVEHVSDSGEDNVLFSSWYPKPVRLFQGRDHPDHSYDTEMFHAFGGLRTQVMIRPNFRITRQQSNGNPGPPYYRVHGIATIRLEDRNAFPSGALRQSFGAYRAGQYLESCGYRPQRNVSEFDIAVDYLVPDPRLIN